MPRVLIGILTVLTVTHVQDTHAKSEPISEETQIDAATSNIDANEELFRRLFAKRRKEHHEAVHGLRRMENYERTYKMITILGEKMIEVIETGKSLIENSSYVPSDNNFPQNGDVKDALFTVLENTAFFGDIVLQLSDITHRILKTRRNWTATIEWALNFANQTRYLLDESTINTLHLASQELNITKRDSNYVNPYRSSINGPSDASKIRKSSKREKRKRGPQMTKIEL